MQALHWTLHHKRRGEMCSKIVVLSFNLIVFCYYFLTGFVMPPTCAVVYGTDNLLFFLMTCLNAITGLLL